MLALGVAVCLLASLFQWARRDLTPYWPGGGLRAQLRIAELVRQTGVEGISPLAGRRGPFGALTGVPVASWPDSDQVLIVTPGARHVERKPKEHYLSLCATVLADTEDALVCLPENLPMSVVALPVTQWGPQRLQVGEVPNPQPNGDGALWFRLDKPQKPRPRLVLVLNGQPGGLAIWGLDGQFLSGPVPRSWVSQPGPVSVELFHLCLSHRQLVGYLQVEPGGF